MYTYLLSSNLLVHGFIRHGTNFHSGNGIVAKVGHSKSFSTTQLLFLHKNTNNSYSQFRKKALSILKNDSNHGSSNSGAETIESKNQNEIAQQAVSLLAQKNKTWKRLSDIVDLTSSSSSSLEGVIPKTIVDIGCDHGLLSIALAVSGRYEKVIGVDISSNALKGAFDFHEKVMDILNRQREDKGRGEKDDDVETRDDEEGCKLNKDQYIKPLPLEFRHGDGLEILQPGEADAICIAGMGVETMLSILCNDIDDKETQSSKISRLEFLNNQILYLQPPKNRPKHLILLYKTLHDKGWIICDERIVKVKNRWYITSAFVKDTEDGNGNFILPGHFLSLNRKYQFEFKHYVEHHSQWLAEDLEKKGEISHHEVRWKETFSRPFIE